MQNLPPSFCRKLKQEKSEWAMLKSRKGTSKIKVCRNGEGVISFEFGWPQFVDHHNLSIGDFVVFEHVGGLKFNVFVFDHSACEKEFLIESKREINKSADHEAVDPSRPKKSNSIFFYLWNYFLFFVYKFIIIMPYLVGSEHSIILQEKQLYHTIAETHISSRL